MRAIRVIANHKDARGVVIGNKGALVIVKQLDKRLNQGGEGKTNVDSNRGTYKAKRSRQEELNSLWYSEFAGCQQN